MTDTTRIILVRHGESNVTVARTIGGMLTCTGLSDLGRQQAARLRDRFAAGHEPAIDELWSSQMPRAIETAEIVNESLALPLNINPDFEEFRPGEADGLRFDDYVEKYGPVDQLAEPFKLLAPGGESRASFFLRVGTAFSELIGANAGRTTMVACHGGVVDAVVRTLLGIHSEKRFYLSTTNTSLTELSTTDAEGQKNWRLVRYNDCAHLAGLPTETVAH